MKHKNQTGIPMPQVNPSDAPMVAESPAVSTESPVIVPAQDYIQTPAEALAASIKAKADNVAATQALSEAKATLATSRGKNQSGVYTVLRATNPHKAGTLSYAAFAMLKRDGSETTEQYLERSRALGTNPGYFFGVSGWIKRGIVRVDAPTKE